MQITAAGNYVEPLCPLCNAATGVVRFAYDDIKIIRCVQCGLWRTCPRLSEEKLTAFYEKVYYSDSIQRSGKYENWRDSNKDVWDVNARLVVKEAQVRGKTAAETKVLDVGCGHGFFLERCVAHGLLARGIETSPHAVKYAKEELKLDVRQMPLDDLPADELYDVITLWGVLEHVPNPLETMKQVHAHLTPGGMTWVMTPNTNALERFFKGAQYFNFLNKSHLTHFHRDTLRALLERAGFSNVQRYIHWGGGARRGPAMLTQYIARWLCLGNELRFIGEKQNLQK